MIRVSRVPGRVPGVARSALLASVLAVALAGVTAAPASADTIELVSQSEKADNPAGLVFNARVRAAAGLKSARLVYKVKNPDTDVGGGGEVPVSPGSEVDVTYSLTTNGAERYIPVGSSFSYRWEFEDTTGAKMSGPEKEFVFLDGRYQWRSVTEGTSPPVTVFWYGANENRARTALDATTVSLRQTGDLLETRVTYPIKVVVYASESDGEAAQRPRGRSFDASVQTGGTRVAPDLVLVFVPDVEIVRHEVAHIVTHVAGDGPFSQLPSWIDEGTAVWAQSSPGGGYLGALALALMSDSTLNLRSMQSSTNRPEEVNLFYGQSFSTVDHLIKNYGQQKFAELFRVFRAGTSMDDALQRVYGFDQNGLYNEWRRAKNLSERTFSTPSAGVGPVTEATRPPLGIPSGSSGSSASQPSSAPAPQSQPGSPGDGAASEASGQGLPTSGIAVLAGTVLLAVVLGGGALVMLRRKPASEA